MERKACVAVTAALLVGVVLALAGSVVAGDTKAAAAHGVGVPPPATTKKLEEKAVPELAPAVDVGVHRRILSSNVGNSALNPNRPACIGSCGARGGPYTGRGCSKAYGCAGG